MNFVSRMNETSERTSTVDTFDFSTEMLALLEDGTPEERTVNRAKIAAITGASLSTISRWCNGLQAPGIDELRKMRDCKQLPYWFREKCAAVTADGRAPERDEVEDLDVDRDGRVTLTDVRLLGAEEMLTGARRNQRMEVALADGRLSPDERVELDRLAMEEGLQGRRFRRALEVAR